MKQITLHIDDAVLNLLREEVNIFSGLGEPYAVWAMIGYKLYSAIDKGLAEVHCPDDAWFREFIDGIDVRERLRLTCES